MTEMVTSGSMSGGGKRSDGLLGESDYERRRSLQAPPALHATALFLDSTDRFFATQTQPISGQTAAAPAIDNNDIGGVVTETNGPEAGVWVIAETRSTPT